MEGGRETETEKGREGETNRGGGGGGEYFEGRACRLYVILKCFNSPPPHSP